ncbi:ATP-binding protein [Streptomyces anulatus]
MIPLYVTGIRSPGCFDTESTGERAPSCDPHPERTSPADAVRSLDHCPQAVGSARRIAREFLDRWMIADAETLVLVVSELVTNAVEHALPPLLLRLRREATKQKVWVGVSDGGPAPQDGPWTSSCTDEEHGRGLGIVDALTDVQQTTTFPDGTAIHWARFAAG